MTKPTKWLWASAWQNQQNDVRPAQSDQSLLSKDDKLQDIINFLIESVL